MQHIDQSRFDNRPEDSELISADEAAAMLGVRRATLYTYASRGLLRSHPDPASHRRRRYRRGEVERLRARADARSGHGPVAAGALDWGEPVIDTAIARIAGALSYRGRDATALAATSTFEAVADLLWDAAGDWSIGALEAEPLRALLPPDARPADALLLGLPWLAARDPARHAAAVAGLPARGRRLVHDALSLLGAPPAGPVAVRLAAALGAPDAAADLDAALVLCADHELNASAFAARVAASTGADLHACVLAALATHSGPKHGGASDRVEALLAAVATPVAVAAVVGERSRRGELLPGFGHPLYPDGDPRVPPLLAAARRRDTPRLAVFEAFLALAAELGHEPPNLDVGLNGLAAAWDLVPGAPRAIFAVGRLAGWVAHAIEQKQDGRLLRPRARYVGP